MALLMPRPFGIEEEPIWVSDRGGYNRFFEEEEEADSAPSSYISYRNYDPERSFQRYYPEQPPPAFGHFREPMFLNNYPDPRMFVEPRLLPPRHRYPPLHDLHPKDRSFRESLLPQQPPAGSQQILRPPRSSPQLQKKVHPEIELRVPLSSSHSADKICNELLKTEGVMNVVCDRANEKVTVTGKVDPQVLLKRAQKVQKKAEFYSPTIYSQNFIDFIQSKTAPDKVEPPQAAPLLLPELLPPPVPQVFSSFQRHQLSPEMRLDTHEDPYFDTDMSARTFSPFEREYYDHDDVGYDDASQYYDGGDRSSSSPYGQQNGQQLVPSFHYGSSGNAFYDHNDDGLRERESVLFPSRPSSSYGQQQQQHHHRLREEFYDSGSRDYSPAAYESNHHRMGTSSSSSYRPPYDPSSSNKRYYELEKYYPYDAYGSGHLVGDSASSITNPNYMQHVITDY